MTGQSRPVSKLGQFFGGYLHEDWPVEYPGAWAAVQAYVSETTLESRAAAKEELSTLLYNSDSEEQLRAAVERVLLSYYPPGDGMTYRAWLEKVERYLRDHES